MTTSTPLIGHVGKEIEVATSVMRGNVEAAMKLGPHLEHLQDKTDDLAKSAQDFRRGASHVRKEIWWKKMKTYICISVGVIILCIVIIVPAVVTSKK